MPNPPSANSDTDSESQNPPPSRAPDQTSTKEGEAPAQKCYCKIKWSYWFRWPAKIDWSHTKIIAEFIFAAAIAIATAVNVVVAYYQWEIAKKGLTASQRAFVYLNKIEAKWLDTRTADPGMVVNITFKIENSGNTPTRGLRIVAGCYPLGPEFPREPFSAFKWEESRVAHLFIGAHQTLDYPGCRMSEIDIDPRQSSPFVERFLMGEIRYFDTVSDPAVEHVTQFAFQLAIHNFDAKTFSLDYETLLTGNHNCSDDECKNAMGDPGPLAAPRWHTY